MIHIFKHGTIVDPTTKSPIPVYVDLDLLFVWYRSPNSASTHLLGNGGAIIPVLESPELVETLKRQNQEKKTNG